jgi:hypothetical protein
MSLNVLIIEKTGNIKDLAIKNFSEAELYKKAGFKTAAGFELQTEWGAEIGNKKYSVSLYGKADGRAGQENKYELPPPLDNVLFFGSCILVNRINGVPTSLTISEWKGIYDHLYGGFEDLDEDEEESSEDSDADDVPRTKEGYVKDDFVVDDDEEDEDYEEEESEEEESEASSDEEEIVIKTRSATAAQKAKGRTKKEAKEKRGAKLVPEPQINNYLDCTSELCEEEYV